MRFQDSCISIESLTEVVEREKIIIDKHQTGPSLIREEFKISVKFLTYFPEKLNAV